MPRDVDTASSLVLRERLADVAAEVHQLANTVKNFKVAPTQTTTTSPRPARNARFEPRHRLPSASPERRSQGPTGPPTSHRRQPSSYYGQPTSFQQQSIGHAAQGRNPQQSSYPQNQACFTCGDLTHKYRQCPFNAGAPTVPAPPRFVRPRGQFQPQFRGQFNSFSPQ